MATCSPHTDCTDEINDPGAAPFGNFINYYTFNPPENRLNLIPATLLRDLDYNGDTTLILDVGCNSGVCMKDRQFGFLKDKIWKTFFVWCKNLLFSFVGTEYSVLQASGAWLWRTVRRQQSLPPGLWLGWDPHSACSTDQPSAQQHLLHHYGRH